MTILNREKILEQARSFIEEGKLDRAIREYEKILLADPTDTRVKLRIAELYTKRKQIGDAIRIYREVADAYTADGFFLKAVTVFKNILRLNPSMIEVNEELAELYERMGLTADAVRQYDILANALAHKGMGERVVEIRRKIATLNPADGTARIRFAETLQREGQMEEAINQYEAYAAQLEAAGGSKGKLADLYEKILAYRPANPELVKKLIGLYEELGDAKKALKWLEQAKEEVEREPRLLKLAAEIYASQNQYETARARYMLLAELNRKAGDVAAALQAYFEILVMLPDEEERLEKRVEELEPGAMQALALRAQARRHEIEMEDHRRHEAEAAAEGREGAPAPEAAASEEGREAPVSTPPVKEERPPEVKIPGPHPPALGMEAMKRERGRGDAAYALATVYQNMGLIAEAHAEHEKALLSYQACLDSGSSDPALIERVTAIEHGFGRSSAPRAEEAAAPAAGPGPVAPAAGEASGKTPHPRVPSPEKKKRVSFV